MLIQIQSQDSQRITGTIVNSGEKMYFVVCFKIKQYELIIASDKLMTSVLYRGRVNALSLEEVEKGINWFIKMNNTQVSKVGNVTIVKWADRTKYFYDVNAANKFKSVLIDVYGLNTNEVQIETVDLY